MKCEAPDDATRDSRTSGVMVREARRDTLPSPGTLDPFSERYLSQLSRRCPRPPDERVFEIECWNASWHESLLHVARTQSSASDGLYEAGDDASAPRIDDMLARRVAEPRDPADFLCARSELLEREKHALLELLRHGSAIAIAWRVARLTARVESSRGSDTVALETLLLLDTPDDLAPFAERLLSEDILVGPYVERILGHSACARALWTVRLAARNISRVHRARFVGWMLAMGPVAREVLVDALVMFAPDPATSRHSDALEDVLSALPVSCDDVLLASVRPFTRSPIARVRELARSAIARAAAEART